MSLTHKYTIICDDVRQENTGKLLLIGVYTGVIGVPQIPCVMPTGLTFFQSWEADRPGQIDLKLKIQHLESGQVLIDARAGMMIVQPGPIIGPIKMGPLQFKDVGTYNLVIEVEGQKDPTIIDFSVQLAMNVKQQPNLPQR